MQATLEGTLSLYQGEAIGLRNVPIDWPMEEYKDIETISYWKKCQELYSGNEPKLAHGKKANQSGTILERRSSGPMMRTRDSVILVSSHV